MPAPLQFGPEHKAGNPEGAEGKGRDEKCSEDVRSRQREGQKRRQALSHPKGQNRAALAVSIGKSALAGSLPGPRERS